MIEQTELQPSAEESVDASYEQASETSNNSADGIPESENDTPIDSPQQNVDYARIAAEDLLTLQREFPALLSVHSIAELPNCTRYGALRDLGLSPREAYLAVGGAQPRRQDNRAHLRSSIPRAHAGIEAQMSSAELENARMLFGNLSDSEIARLYQKVQA